MYTKSKFIFCGLLIFLFGCWTPEKPMQTKKINLLPTSHTFDLPIQKMHDTIFTLFDSLDIQMNNKLLASLFYYYTGDENEYNSENHRMEITFYPETKKDTIFSREYFRYAPVDAIYLHDFGQSWKSPIYYAEGKSLDYTTDFGITFDSISSSRTRVTIKALSPVVYNGTFGWGPHGPAAREVSVTPTTVEEFTLLKFLALELQDTTLGR